ncbi:glyoxalase family protein [Verrucomicrobiia bacterium DG1235]|nr:glyoxalase family protein [Verrucomicrobiae bacterium DG1235]
MKIEHVAFNVTDPNDVAAWYVAHLGMTVARKIEEAPFTHFLADSSGSVMIEIYNNPSDQVPDYRSMHPLLLHVAFVSADPNADQTRLEAAGATFAEEVKTPDGSHLVMLRDPWGLALQLCRRGQPML